LISIKTIFLKGGCILSKENTILLSNFNINLVFDVNDYNLDYPTERTMKISCIDDMEYVLKEHYNKNWKELFENKDIVYAVLSSLQISAKDDNENNKVNLLMDTSKMYGQIKYDFGFLQDENANKIDAIRKIIGK